MQQPGAAEPSGLTVQRSRQTAVLVNIVKVALLAALAPPVVSGIADKATQFGAPSDTATVVGVALSLGAIGAVLGAVLLGRGADIGRGTHRSRWAWVAAGAATGTIGLALAAVSSAPALLIGGWMIAQFGYSGAMAVLRALLASIRQSHLRRGAVAVVFSAYGGLAIPLVLLLLFPAAAWETSLGLACVALLSPLCVITWFPPARTGAALDTMTQRTGSKNHNSRHRTALRTPLMRRRASRRGGSSMVQCTVCCSCSACLRRSSQPSLPTIRSI